MRTHKKETFLLFCRGIQSDKTLVAVRLRLKLLHTRHATSPGLLQQRPAFRMDPTQQRPAPLAAQPPPLEPPHAEPHTFLLWVRACGATRKRNRNFKRRKIENKVSQAAIRLPRGSNRVPLFRRSRRQSGRLRFPCSARPLCTTALRARASEKKKRSNARACTLIRAQ